MTTCSNCGADRRPDSYCEHCCARCGSRGRITYGLCSVCYPQVMPAGGEFVELHPNTITLFDSNNAWEARALAAEAKLARFECSCVAGQWCHKCDPCSRHREAIRELEQKLAAAEARAEGVEREPRELVETVEPCGVCPEKERSHD